MSDIGSIVVEGRMVTFNISASVAGCEDGVHGIMLRSEHRRQIDSVNRIHREDEDVWDQKMNDLQMKIQAQDLAIKKLRANVAHDEECASFDDHKCDCWRSHFMMEIDRILDPEKEALDD